MVIVRIELWSTTQLALEVDHVQRMVFSNNPEVCHLYFVVDTLVDGSELEVCLPPPNMALLRLYTR